MRPQTPPYITFCCLLTAVLVLLAGCSKDEGFDETKTAEITLQTDVWRIMDATRATTFDNQAALQTKGAFTCAVYNAETTTPYINATSVNWDGTASKWEFSDGKHYWPASGSLDFFAYMPAAAPSYITGPTYTTARAPQFVCTGLPMTYNSENTAAGQGSDLKEFLCALTTGQNKAGQGNSGVTMTFKHPFARIKFQLKESHRDVKVNAITFKGLKTGGTCTFNGTATWSSLTPADATADLEAFLNQECYSNPDTPVTLGPASGFLVVPQEWEGNIVVSADWVDWGESFGHIVRTTVPTEWEAGYTYTYTFNINTKELVVSTTKYTEQW